MQMSFKLFLEEFKDIFGFSDEIDSSKPELKVLDENPIKTFPIIKMTEYLAKQQINGKEGFSFFNNDVIWGEGAGALKVHVDPQLTVSINRQIYDLEGTPTWITKSVSKINTEDYQQYCEAVGDSLYEEIVKISKENLESPQKQYNLENLVTGIIDEVSQYGSSMLIYDSNQKVNENNYLINYLVKGGGAGSLLAVRSQNKINKTVVNVHFDESIGLCKINCGNVVSGHEGISFRQMPPFFSGNFAVNQPVQQIAFCVATAMKWF